MKLPTAVRMAAACGICLLAAAVGALFTGQEAMNWYAQLRKPSFTPPNWAFAPVWTLLYLLMGLALFIVWQKGTETKGVLASLFSFGIQLLLNALWWTPLFFGLRRPAAALVELLALLAAIVIAIIYIRRVSLIAAVLMLPYLAWTGFAAVLNGGICYLNR